MKHTTTKTLDVKQHRGISINLNQDVRELYINGELKSSTDVGKPYYSSPSRFAGFINGHKSLDDIKHSIDMNLDNASNYKLWSRIRQSKEDYLKELRDYGIELKLEDLT